MPAQRGDDEPLSAPEPEGTEARPQPPMREREPRIVLLWQTADGRVLAREEVRGDGGFVLGLPGRIVLGSVEQTPRGTVTEVLEAETPVVVAYWQDEVVCAEAQGGG